MLVAERHFREGRWDDVESAEHPIPPPPTAAPPADGTNSPKQKTLAAAAEAYLSDTPMRPETARDLRTLITRLTQVIGVDRQIRSIQADDIREFRELAKQLPSRPTRVQQAMLLRSLAQSNQGSPDNKKLTQRTLNKWFDLLSALFEHALKHREIDYNPIRGLKTSKKKISKEKPRVPLSDSELSAFFTSPLFLGCRSVKQRHLRGPQIIKDGAC